MEVISKSKKECDVYISKKISELIKQILQKKKQVVMGIPGGRSVQDLFKLLKKEKIDWSKVHIFMVDERMVPLDDKESNFKLAKESFIEQLVNENKLPKNNVHPFNINKGVESYNKEFQQFGGKYDLVILGVGEDGHVAALFPNHNSLNDKKEESNEDFFITINDPPKPPLKRMTSSLSLLIKSSIGIILFYGESKRKAYEMFNNEKIQIKQCPAKLVHGMEKVYVATDLDN